MKKSAYVQRSVDITEDEKNSASKAISAFDDFLKKLYVARKADNRLVNVLKQNQEINPSNLYQIRHLLRRFQKEVKERYTDLIVSFAGKKDINSQTIYEGYIHTLAPLEKDTKTNTIKIIIQDSMQQLVENMENFLDVFEDFNNKDQITNIINISIKIDKIVKNIENIIDTQLKPHFEKNILKRKISSIRNGILRRTRIIELLGDTYDN